jgi:hypothetical protein
LGVKASRGFQGWDRCRKKVDVGDTDADADHTCASFVVDIFFFSSFLFSLLFSLVSFLLVWVWYRRVWLDIWHCFAWLAGWRRRAHSIPFHAVPFRSGERLNSLVKGLKLAFQRRGAQNSTSTVAIGSYMEGYEG